MRAFLARRTSRLTGVLVLALGILAFAVQPPASADDPYTDYSVKSQFYGFCLDVPHSSHNKSLQLQVYTCNQTGAQQWYIWMEGTDGWVQIENAGDSLCLDTRYAETGEGGVVQQYLCNNSEAERWRFKTDAGITYLQNMHSLKCITIPDAGSGAPLYTYTCNSSNLSQRWYNTLTFP